jgi:hypothetical protein
MGMIELEKSLLERAAEALEPFVNWPRPPRLPDYDRAAFVLDDIRAGLAHRPVSAADAIERATAAYLAAHDGGAP